MSMYTRCSSCNTHFKVTVQQLQACSGQVRCGRCATVFDAFASLTARLPGKADEPPPLEHTERPSTWSAPEFAGAGASLPLSAARHAVGTAGVGVASDSSIAHSSAAFPSVAQNEAIAMKAPMSVGRQHEPATLSLPDNLFSQAYTKALPGAPWMWSSGIAVLALVALLQLMFFFRTELAAAAPSLRSTLLALCKPFSCEVPLPRYPDSLFIESSDLQVVDSKRPNQVLLTAAIRNRAERLQAYPTLELTLTNTMDHPIAKRVFAPREYLAESVAASQGFAPGAEVAVRLMLNTGELRASGYRLFLYFPN